MKGKENDEDFLYKTVDSFISQSKKRFRYNVYIALGILSLLGILIFLVNSLVDQKNNEISEIDQKKKEKEELSNDVVNFVKKIGAEVNFDSLPGLSAKEKANFKKGIDSIAAKTSTFGKDTVYVWAKSGLNVRKSNGINSTKLAGFPYGKPLRKLKQTEDIFYSQLIYDGKIYGDSLVLKNSWHFIQSDTLKGYAFGGFLSPLPVFKAVQSINEYLNLLKMNNTVYDHYIDNSSGNNENILVEIKNIDINQGFLLIRNIYSVDSLLENSNEPKVNIQPQSWSINTDRYIFEITSENEYKVVIKISQKKSG